MVDLLPLLEIVSQIKMSSNHNDNDLNNEDESLTLRQCYSSQQEHKPADKENGAKKEDKPAGKESVGSFLLLLIA